MSLLARKPFNYPIAISVNVLKCTEIKHQDSNWSFKIELSSNVTTWNIEHTLSEFEELDFELREYKELESIKLPRSITQFPASKFHETGKKMIEDYLWKLLRRAYIFISIPIQKFIELPIIMEQKTNLLSQQLRTIIREDIMSYLVNINNINNVNNHKYNDIKCILRSSYILDGYNISNIDDINNELNEGFNINNEYLFRIDIVEIKRVMRYQKECKFAIEIQKGKIYSFKCKNQQQFNQWVNDIKNMIKAQGGYTPYLIKWEDGGIENDSSLEEKVIEKIDIDIDSNNNNDTYSDYHSEHGPLSNFSSIHRISTIAEEKHNEYRYNGYNGYNGSISQYGDDGDDDDDDDDDDHTVDRVDIDIEESMLSSNELSETVNTINIINKEKEKEEDSEDSIDREIKQEMIEQERFKHENREQIGKLNNKLNNKKDEMDEITLKLRQEDLDKKRRNSMIMKQKERILNRNRNGNKNVNNSNKLILKSERSSLISYNTMNSTSICHIASHKNMISQNEYNLLRSELIKWQSKAHRWQDMANRHERNHETTELKLQQKELRYKAKIRDQQNEILTLTKLLKKKDIELQHKINELKQLESASNIAIQQLLTYKNTNEMRKKNSYIDGTLWKFAGDGINNVKFNKQPKLKYVMYVPTKRKLYYSDSNQDYAETKLINVTHISHRNQDIINNIPDKYKNIWIKIIGQNRIILFVAKNQDDADRWYDTIKNSL